MKPILQSIVAILITAYAGQISWAEEKHEDHKAHEAGPNGGRVITSLEPHLEFFVTEDRKVKITALNEELKPIAIGEQSVRLTGGSRSNPTRLSFAKDGTILMSDAALPEGNDLPIVLQISPGGDGATVMEKFNLNLSECPTCKFKEYACICEHGDHKDHDHKEK